MAKILPKKGQKNPMAMGIAKFNLGFRVACTSERHKAMGDNDFLFLFLFSILSCN